MLGLYSSPRPASLTARSHRLARIGLEHLEDRTTPSTLSLFVEYECNKTISLYGDLTDTSNPANRTITISGKASGSTTTDANGHFQITLNATELGQVTATADDGASASVTLEDAMIVIEDFVAIEDMGFWNFRGYVLYGRMYNSITVCLNGSPDSIWNQNITVQTDAMGYFEFTIMLNGTHTDNGGVWVWAISPWGTLSEEAHEVVSQMGT